MTVSLTFSETLGGAAYADALAGGDTGIDFGAVSNGIYTPLVDQPTNDGRKVLFITHDAAVDPITGLKFYAAQFSGTYGGADTAANDFTTLKAQGAASSSADANNDDGLASGLHVEMDYDVSMANQFDPSRIGTLVYIFGDDTTDGIDLSSAFTVVTDSMLYNNAAVETAPTTPVAGSVGKSGDAVLGDNSKTYWRYYLKSSATTGGILQFDIAASYSFTA